MTRDGFSCFLGFQNFSGDDPVPPFQIKKYAIYFLNQHCSTLLLNSEAFNKRVNNNISDWWAIHLFARDLLHPFYTIIYHNLDLKIKIRY